MAEAPRSLPAKTTLPVYVIDPIKCYLIGGSIVAAGLFTHSKKKARLTSWTPAVGSVQNIRRDRDGDATVFVRFSDQTGQLRTAAMKVADGDSIGLGVELEISYNPKNPEQAFVRSVKDMNLSLYLPLVAGLLLLGLGVFSRITLAGLDLNRERCALPVAAISQRTAIASARGGLRFNISRSCRRGCRGATA